MKDLTDRKTAYKRELIYMHNLTDRYTVAIGLVFDQEYFDTFPTLRKHLFKADAKADLAVQDLKDYLSGNAYLDEVEKKRIEHQQSHK